MHETSKAQKRREKDTEFPWVDVFKGDGLDVGCGDDPLRIAGCEPFDLPDGGGDDITKFIDGEFNYIHGSQVLEHALDPTVMLNSWLKILRPQGYIVATVPDFNLYEKNQWPSKFNDGHRSAWTTDAETKLSADKLHIPIQLLPMWLNPFAAVKRCILIDTNYNYATPEIDQTYNAAAGVECFIEFVLQKS